MRSDSPKTPTTLEELTALMGSKPSRRAAQFEQLAALAEQRKKMPATRALRLIGVDPGTRCLGWGVVDFQPRTRTLALADCGCIQADPKAELKDRLCVIFEGLERVIARMKPDLAALEETFGGVNVKSAIAMGQGRGIALLCLGRAGLNVLEVAPRSIKQALTGSGAASKAQVGRMVAAQLGMKKAPKPEDISDALAAAITLSQRL